MRRTLKFLHTMGAIGLMGAMACLVVMLSFTPPPAVLAGYALMRGAMGAVASWIFLPSLALTLLAGLLALAQRAFHNAGWAWVKLATGVLMFEGGLVYVQGPMRQEADLSAAALAGHGDPALLGQALEGEGGTLWLLLAVATVNVVLGIWRPRLIRPPARAAGP
ncbi:hypothetical protein ASF28_01220 [Methylobacterium sp. Leaf99]|uniref:hypothetical protein n=1 Tax=Methylobacterium sp. Leaf99 TaxID=1736251 RepID=UPI0006F5801A|nr:hypothetical protein [Methylobacterium sp. Leaf99]KQP09831.1 hypothetical protein ASF28_01220 [Methylobacterium sp. Leaf99]